MIKGHYGRGGVGWGKGGTLAVVRLEATLRKSARMLRGGGTGRLPESVSSPYHYREVWGIL